MRMRPTHTEKKRNAREGLALRAGVVHAGGGHALVVDQPGEWRGELLRSAAPNDT